MNFDIKTLAIFLPFLAAALYGVTYTANGKLLGTVNLPTYLLIYCIAGIGLVLMLHLFSPAKIDFSSLTQKRMTVFAAVSVVSSLMGWTLVLVSIPLTSAIYTAAGEISYPLFTALFTYLIFQSCELTWQTAIGGLLIMAGSFILVSGKLKVGG
jgi:drug/metabolite transporter (DMT)-like permease